MIGLKTLLDIICTEAVEYGGVQEVPDRSDGTVENYHDFKRSARGDYEGEAEITQGQQPPINHRLQLLQKADGTLYWIE